MTDRYFELRKSSARGTDSLTADMMRHLHARQHLGKALVICDQPQASLPIARKQWMKLSRNAQKQRASTLSADKILKYTHAIVTMQRMRFSSKAPLENPEADIYFIAPTDALVAPAQCFTVYLNAAIPRKMLKELIDQLPADALVVDYTQEVDWMNMGLLPKNTLETAATEYWEIAQRYLEEQNIAIEALHDGQLQKVEAIDDALDTLLASPHQFLRVATDFQQALELARPLRLSKKLRRDFDSLMLLAHRVQTLTKPAFSRRFLENYNEDDTFFLYDAGRKRFVETGETIAEAIARHLKAERHNIARLLQEAA